MTFPHRMQVQFLQENSYFFFRNFKWADRNWIIAVAYGQEMPNPHLLNRFQKTLKRPCGCWMFQRFNSFSIDETLLSHRYSITNLLMGDVRSNYILWFFLSRPFHSSFPFYPISEEKVLFNIFPRNITLWNRPLNGCYNLYPSRIENLFEFLNTKGDWKA